MPTEIRQQLDVVGVRFRMKADARAALAAVLKRKPLKVTLEREHENKYDENAIKVTGVLAGDDHHLGYVRATSAVVLAPKLDDGSVKFKSAKLVMLYEPKHEDGVMDVVLVKR